MLACLLLLTASACRERAEGTGRTPVPPSDAAAPTAAEPAPAPPALPGATLWDVSELAKRVTPVVVNITITQRAPKGSGLDLLDDLFGIPAPGRQAPDARRPARTGLGTGFIVAQDGLVVTNEHVVRSASDVRVRLADGREFDAEVIGRDRKLDLALLRLEGITGLLPVALLGSSERLEVGDGVIAVGNPFGLGHTVTAGIVSAKARAIGLGPYDDFIQTDASINPGNSGGPLFDASGSVVGIATAIRAGANGIGFAIPIDAFKEVLPALRDKGRVDRGRVGVAFQPLTKELANALGLEQPRGALVTEVEPGGPASRAGIRAGDVIVAVDGTRVGTGEEVPRLIARHAPGDRVELHVFRGGKEQAHTVTLVKLEEPEPADARAPEGTGQPAGNLGIQVSEADGKGVRVEAIAPDARVGELSPGDVVVEIGGNPVRNIQELRRALGAVKPGSTVLAKVQRGGASRFIALTLPQPKQK